jgi:hypothetical protein
MDLVRILNIYIIPLYGKLKTNKKMANKRFNLVLNEEQMYYLSHALECALEVEYNSKEVDEPASEYCIVIQKIKERLDK